LDLQSNHFVLKLLAVEAVIVVVVWVLLDKFSDVFAALLS
jgi:hypothetical protein